ncbi:MAG: hypothetical protein ACR2NN_13605 [Bryobacteraceae bacterium]
MWRESLPVPGPLAEENTQQSNPYRAQSRESGPSGLERVREAAQKDSKLKFTALLHHVSIDLLRDSYYSLKKKAAPGVDGVTWEEYAFTHASVEETWRRA